MPVAGVPDIVKAVSPDFVPVKPLGRSPEVVQVKSVPAVAVIVSDSMASPSVAVMLFAVMSKTGAVSAALTFTVIVAVALSPSEFLAVMT